MIASWAKAGAAAARTRGRAIGRRLAILLSELGNRPVLSIPAACGGRAEMKAAYRFFDNDKVTFEKVIEPHIAQTKDRIAAQKIVLLVQDTTEVVLTRPEQEVEGSGELDGARRGFLLHDCRPSCPMARLWAPRGLRCSIERKGFRMRPRQRKGNSGDIRPLKKRRASLAYRPA